MTVSDEEVRTGDKLEIPCPLKNWAGSLPWFLREFGYEDNRIQEGSLYKSCSREC
jgi:hypothetical protein